MASEVDKQQTGQEIGIEKTRAMLRALARVAIGVIRLIRNDSFKNFSLLSMAGVFLKGQLPKLLREVQAVYEEGKKAVEMAEAIPAEFSDIDMDEGVLLAEDVVKIVKAIRDALQRRAVSE